jgi:hypothetical protein
LTPLWAGRIKSRMKDFIFLPVTSRQVGRFGLVAQNQRLSLTDAEATALAGNADFAEIKTLPFASTGTPEGQHYADQGVVCNDGTTAYSKTTAGTLKTGWVAVN